MSHTPIAATTPILSASPGRPLQTLTCDSLWAWVCVLTIDKTDDSSCRRQYLVVAEVAARCARRSDCAHCQDRLA